VSKSLQSHIWGWFVDPYQRKVHNLLVPKELKAWYQALEADCLDMGRLNTRINGRFIDVWVDDCGQMRKPPLVTFSLEGRMFYGYALIFEGDSAGETCSASFDSDFLIKMLCLTFDPAWEKRLQVANYFPQLTRVVEWEKWHAPKDYRVKQITG
jgi:hypothetical protein